MITKYIEYNIICDICKIDGCNTNKASWHPEGFKLKDWNSSVPYSETGIKEMRHFAKECGWVYKNGKDICPKCQAKMKGGNENV